MPNYFPENDTALPTDSSERSMAKVVSQLPAALDVIGLEPETAVYVARSGATDVAAIDAFVKGVKELGLWNSMVCWPLRRSQNSGGVNPNSNIVYSLGGLGTFNGTRVNGPAWTADGIAHSPTQYIDIRFGSNRGPTSAIVGAVTKSANNQGSGFAYCSSLSTNAYTENSLSILSFGTSGNSWCTEAYVASSLVARGSAINNTDNVFRWTQAQKTSSDTIVRVNGSTQAVSLAGGLTYDRLISAGRWAANSVQNGAAGQFSVSYEGTHAFMFVLEGSSDFYNAYSLYKTTLGTGLGLP